MVPSGTPVRYLGILLGHHLDDQVQINALSDSFYQSFVTWGYRERTLRGRRLLVNTMILSKLWHYTAVIHIPDKTIAKWQSMVNKFIMARKRHKEDSFMSMINPGVAYHPTIGLHIPHLASRIRTQRVYRPPPALDSVCDLTSPSNFYDGTWSRSRV